MPRRRTPAKSDEDVTSLSDVEVTEDPTRFLPSDSSGSSFGFNKPLLETPRSVSFISREQIDLYDLSSVADLGRVMAGVYTPARYGIEGSIDVRGVPADSYLRGMKRVVLQGNARSVLAAMDSIEVVKGPPSPIYGLGKIGGYTNFVPKSGRANVGGYLRATRASSRPSWARTIAASSRAASADRSLSVTRRAATTSTDCCPTPIPTTSRRRTTRRWCRPRRRSTIWSARFASRPARSIRTAPRPAHSAAARHRRSSTTRPTSRAIPLVPLDVDGNGQISWREMNAASPVRGNLNANNQPLVQTFAWPKDAQGNYLPLDQFPKLQGIPQTMYSYLVAHPEADPTGLLRAQGVGGPVPMSGQLPAGFVLDPRTVGYAQLSNEERRRASAHERELDAKFLTYYADLINDTNPDLTYKNQLSSTASTSTRSRISRCGCSRTCG